MVYTVNYQPASVRPYFKLKKGRKERRKEGRKEIKRRKKGKTRAGEMVKRT